MTLEEFVELVTVDAWAERRPALVAILEPSRASIEHFTEGMGPDHVAAESVARAMWHRLEDADPGLHRKVIEIAEGGRVT